MYIFWYPSAAVFENGGFHTILGGNPSYCIEHMEREKISETKQRNMGSIDLVLIWVGVNPETNQTSQNYPNKMANISWVELWA